jgi:hypothetical protein
MGEFLVLTVLIHLCLRLNWLSRYVIVLLFDNIIIVVVVMIVLILFMTWKYNTLNATDIIQRKKTWLHVHLMDKQRTRGLFIYKQWTRGCIIVFFVFNRRYKLFMVNEVRQFTSVFNGRVSRVNKIHMVNKFTVSRVKAVQVNKENDKILLIAIGNVLKNKYIHIVNNIVCVFQMSINIHWQYLHNNAHLKYTNNIIYNMYIFIFQDIPYCF